MICYKVVNEDNTSAFVTGKSYARKYQLGEIVTAKKNTLGIFCFKDLLSVRKWCNPSSFKILLVESMGEPLVPEVMCVCYRIRYLNSFYNHDKPKRSDRWKTNNVPQGTICFPAVKVLDVVEYK